MLTLRKNARRDPSLLILTIGHRIVLQSTSVFMVPCLNKLQGKRTGEEPFPDHYGNSSSCRNLFGFLTWTGILIFSDSNVCELEQSKKSWNEQRDGSRGSEVLDPSGTAESKYTKW